MIEPWCEQQRQAVRAFRQAILERAQRESEIADGAQARLLAAEEHYGAEKERVEGEYAAAQADALARAERSRQQMQQRHDRERDKLEREHHKTKDLRVQ